MSEDGGGEAMPQTNLVLKCWGPEWGLSSIDIDSLSIICYSKFNNAPLEVKPVLPKDTITGILPELESNEIVYTHPSKIISILRRDGYNADFHLTEEDSADTLAFLSLIEQKLKPAILYTLWLDAGNYTKVVRPAYANVSGFPWSLWYPSRIRKFIESSIVLSKGGNFAEAPQEIERQVYRDAQQCMNILESRLGNKDYFFGKTPSTIDAVIYGHLAVLSKAPLVSLELKNHLNACTNLCNFCFRVGQQYFPKLPQSPSKQIDPKPNEEQFLKHDQVLTIAAGVGALILYALTSGVLTAKQSRLADSFRKGKRDALADLDD